MRIEQVSSRAPEGKGGAAEGTSVVTDWDAWELGRVVLATATVMYAGIWAQVSLFHWGAAFASPVMWVPVVVTPFIAA